MKDFRKTRRKRIEAWLTAAMFLFGTLTGCGSVSDTHGDVGTPNDGKLKVVTTLFPYYDFTRQIAGDAVDLSMVIPAGQDSHSFEPTPADIRLIQNADLLICNGGAMEQWVSQVVASLDSESLKVITMMDYVDTVEEEIVEGMEDAGEEHHHSHASADDTHDDHDHDEAVHADDDDHDHDHEEHEHHHDHDHEEHEHHHDHDGHCCCGHDHGHGHHHADEVFTSWGKETPHKFTREKIEEVLKTLSESEEYGMILRAKGMVEDVNGSWIYFDMVPGEYELRDGEPDYTGRLCVIGSKIDEHKIEELFGIA